MKPPTFSTRKPPAPSWKENKRRNYISTHVVRAKEGIAEPPSSRQSGWDPIQSVDQMRTDWDASREDRDSFKQWLAAQGLKGGRV